MDAGSILQAQQGENLNLTGKAKTGSGLAGKNAADSSQKLVDNFQTFVELLTTQLQNQTPKNSADPSKFTRQLVSFSQVEQQIGTNEKLDKLINAQETSEIASAANVIGQRATAVSDKVQLTDGKATIGYKLDAPAQSASIEIKNQNGQVVRTLDVSGAKGEHTVKWNGQNSGGEPLDDGVYKVSLNAENAKGESVGGNTRAVGEVTGFDRTSDGVVLKMGGVEFPFSDLKSVG